MAIEVGVVCVPFITTELHFELMQRTLKSLLSCDHNFALAPIAVVNRFTLDASKRSWLDNICAEVIVNDKNILARAWNVGITRALERGARYVLVINLDILFHQGFLLNLINFAERQPQVLLWSGVDWPELKPIEQAPLDGPPISSVHMSCFLCDQRLFQLVGTFDENFIPAYHEDNDMGYRIKLAGQKTLSTPAAVYRHFDRMTLKCAAEAGQTDFLIETQYGMDASLKYYRKKWGGLPGEETFKVPFDGKMP